MPELDSHTMLDLAVLAFTAIQSYQNIKVKSEITELKLWIVSNFEAKKDAKFFGV